MALNSTVMWETPIREATPKRRGKAKRKVERRMQKSKTSRPHL